jgi:hypothetical protein
VPPDFPHGGGAGIGLGTIRSANYEPDFNRRLQLHGVPRKPKLKSDVA